MALRMYVDDNKDLFPAYRDWATWGGAAGSNRVFTSGAPWQSGSGLSLHGGGENPTNRPLNRYLGNVQVCRCPADKGDPLWPEWRGTCFDGWGNSYLMQWYYDCYGVERVGGEANLQMTAAISPPNTGARVAHEAGHQDHPRRLELVQPKAAELEECHLAQCQREDARCPCSLGTFIPRIGRFPRAMNKWKCHGGYQCSLLVIGLPPTKRTGVGRFTCGVLFLAIWESPGAAAGDH